MGETQSRPTTKGRRSSTGETNVLIPPPSRLALTSSSKIIVEIDIAFLVSSYAAYDLYALSSTCKQFQSVTNCVKIFQCIHKSDVKRLRRLLRHTTANMVSFKDPCNGRNAFHVAATSGHPEILELLLEFYPKLHDLPDKFDLTPLHLASIRGSKSMVRTLLEKGADPNKADWNGHTSLHFTTFAESKIIADELIRHGADVNTKSKKDGSTPAHFVCLRCVQSAPALLSLLEASGANLKELNCSDQTPLHVAAFSNNVRAIEFLLENYSDTCVLRDRCGRTPFMYSVASGCVDTSTQILNANQGVLNMIDGNGMTALHVACQRNSRDHVSMLLNRGADVNIADNLGVTPLHVACHDHDADEVVIGELIRSGSRLDVCDSHGLTPLHIMCARGRYDLIRDIIFHVDTKTLSSSSSESTILLPRERARRSFQILTNCDSKKLFQSADDKGWNVSHFVSSSNNIELLGLLIDAGCDVNRKAKDGVTPLHIASTKSVAMVHLLLASGSKPKQRANGGITPVQTLFFPI
jgi:ankyrin repeat protein